MVPPSHYYAAQTNSSKLCSVPRQSNLLWLICKSCVTENNVERRQSSFLTVTNYLRIKASVVSSAQASSCAVFCIFTLTALVYFVHFIYPTYIRNVYERSIQTSHSEISSCIICSASLCAAPIQSFRRRVEPRAKWSD